MVSPAGRRRAGRRRDRRGRGVRGPLVPSELPIWRSRSEAFDELVLETVERLGRRLPDKLDSVEFAVEDVPPSDPAPWEHGEISLGRLFPSEGSLPPRIVVYRRPVESRAEPADRAALVHDVVVEQVAHLLDLPPEDVDPLWTQEE